MTLTVAAVQMTCRSERAQNLDHAEALVREAASRGADLVLLQEMFADRFFAFMDWTPRHYELAETLESSAILARMSDVARDVGVVLPVNVFERAGNAYYNTVVLIDADGRRLGHYRKTHIPAGPPGCFEKIYTSPGDTGFKVWETACGVVGSGVCWDQWFPEAARIMCLFGADVLCYPTGIGSDCHGHWQRTMQGHAAANLTPLVCANRVGSETGEWGTTNFWGRSFIADETGAIADEADSDDGRIVLASFDLAAQREKRAAWGVFRDRRPDTYGPLLTLDGRTRVPMPV